MPWWGSLEVKYLYVFVQRVLIRNWDGRGLQGYMTLFGHRFGIVLDIVFFQNMFSEYV